MAKKAVLEKTNIKGISRVQIVESKVKPQGSIGWLIFWVIFGGGIGGVIYFLLRDWRTVEN